jgi:hypothetical protein
LSELEAPIPAHQGEVKMSGITEAKLDAWQEAAGIEPATGKRAAGAKT